jgi:polyhydroxybutyrate depolymerase
MLKLTVGFTSEVDRVVPGVRTLGALAVGVLLIVGLLWAHAGIGAAHGSEKACRNASRHEVPNGYYLARAPADWDGASPLPLIVYFHGWNASPEGTFRNRAMVNAANRRGALFVAPWAASGYWRQIGPGRSEGGRDELAYAKAVLADVKRCWPIDDRLILASGFSRGASMVWNLACYGGDLLTGFAPIAGGFWNDTPDTCPTGPVNLRHIHGLRDRVVAFEAVGIYNSMPIPEGLAVLRRLNGCGEPSSASTTHLRYTCKRWADCETGRELALCRHGGGHSIPAEWVAEGLDWLVTLGH